MESEPDPARKRASREATEWSILLRDDPDDVDLRRRFDAWLAASPLHAECWRLTERASDLAAEALPAFAHEWPARNGWPERDGKNDNIVPLAGRRPARRRWLVPAASLALAAAIALVAGPAVVLRLQ